MSGLEARSGAKKSASGGNPLTVQEMDRLLKVGVVMMMRIEMK